MGVVCPHCSCELDEEITTTVLACNPRPDVAEGAEVANFRCHCGHMIEFTMSVRDSWEHFVNRIILSEMLDE